MWATGWRLSTLQEHILHADFGERYAFSRGVFWVGDEIVFTRMCHVEVQEGRGVVMRLGGRCVRGRSAAAGVDRPEDRGMPKSAELVGLTVPCLPVRRCRGQDMSRTCGAGMEVHLTLQENWEGRRRICGWGRETSCMCGVAVVGASGAPAHVQMHPDTVSRVDVRVDEHSQVSWPCSADRGLLSVPPSGERWRSAEDMADRGV